MTAEDWAPYAVPGTEPDADGWYPDYLPVPERLKPERANASAVMKQPEVDGSLYAIVTHWRIVVAELIPLGIDLYDTAVLARPWPGVRTAIFALLENPDSRLRAALTRR